jgi:hypothetical protein
MHGPFPVFLYRQQYSEQKAKVNRFFSFVTLDVTRKYCEVQPMILSYRD